MQPIPIEKTTIDKTNQIVSSVSITNKTEPTIKKNELVVRKKVNFNLKNYDLENSNAITKFERRNLNKPHCLDIYNKTMKIKNVVYNGTFPIDLPLSSRFNEFEDNYDESSVNEYDEDENENEQYEDDYLEDDSEPRTSLSMNELLKDKEINLNYGKVKYDFENSFLEFEKILDKNNGTRRRDVKSFNIDEPIM